MIPQQSKYLYQLELLHILPTLGEQVFVPPAVVDEIEVGRSLGVSLPDLSELDWVTIQQPLSEQALPLITNLGPGETEVLMLALEMREAVAVLDDGLAREIADTDFAWHRRPTRSCYDLPTKASRWICDTDETAPHA